MTCDHSFAPVPGTKLVKCRKCDEPRARCQECGGNGIIAIYRDAEGQARCRCLTCSGTGFVKIDNQPEKR